MGEYNGPIHKNPNGTSLEIDAGGALNLNTSATMSVYGLETVQSGGTLAVADGGALVLPFITAADSTAVTAAQSGSTFLVTAADKVMTLPATAKGLRYTFIVSAAGLSSGTGLSISPAAADQIIGNGFTPADDKDAVNTGATDAAGDSITLVGDGVAGWYIVAVTGTWARET